MSLESADVSEAAAAMAASLADTGADQHEDSSVDAPVGVGASDTDSAEMDAGDPSPLAHDQDATDDSAANTNTTASADASPTDPTGGALFDYSSYTGGAPSLLSVATSSGVASVTSDTSNSVVVVASSLFGQELDAAAADAEVGHHELVMGSSASNKPIEVDDKNKIGRPSHPAWEHFARGEKRNRFHHNAYCRYCAANGVEPEAVRGVSENMIRHLQKCVYCPEEIVTQLKMLCAQKDAARFSKRHQTHPSDVDMLLHHDSSPLSSNKRVKRVGNTTTSFGGRLVGGGVAGVTATAAMMMAANGNAIPLPADVASGNNASSSVNNSSSNNNGNQFADRHHSVDEEEFMPLQLPLLPSEIANAATQNALSLQSSVTSSAMHSGNEFTSKHPSGTRTNSSVHMKARLRGGEFAAKKAPVKTSFLRNDSSNSHHQQQSEQRHQVMNTASKSVDPELLNRLVMTATLSAGLPWNWTWMEESARLFGDMHASLELPRLTLLPSITSSSHKKQFAKMKSEHVGVTLAINSWVSKYQKSHFALFSLVNALGEASVYDLVDLGLEEPASDVLADTIKNLLMTLHSQSVQVINIVVDTTNAYAAARFAVSSMENSSHDIPVLPCFSQFLSLVLGVVLTVSDVYVETMGDVIEIVQMFSNHRVLKVLRRECGDQDAALVLPAKDNWYSFIECIDSVRQYEDMIKIIASKVLAASSGSGSGGNGGSGIVRPTRKDSAGNTVDELAETRLSSSVLRAIQNPEFWENVVSLSELMSPIKETHKIMTSGAVSQFSLSDVVYQFGRMHQQYGIIISDWEDNTCGRRTLEHVRFLQETVNKMWRLYDQPLMFLSYILNYNLVYPHVSSLSHPSLQWLSIGKYAKEYFRRWFCSASPLPASRAAGPAAAGGAGTALPRLPLSEDTASRFLEDILAYKERKYPFDMESVCEFENPRSFYLLVSDSNPLMHLFGSRLFSFATSTPPLADVVDGISFVSSATSSVCNKDVLLVDLRMKLFAQTAVQPSKELLAFLQNSGAKMAAGDQPANAALHHSPLPTAAVAAGGVSRGSHSGSKGSSVDCGMDARACSTVWNKKQWTRLAKEWRAHWEKETEIDELLRSLALLDPGLFRFSPNLSLDQIFKDKLPSRLPQDREEAVVDV